MEHIYLHTNDLNITKDLNNDHRFQPIFEYNLSFRNLPKNEYGRIRTDKNYYHILLGNIPQENCPWCGGCGKVVKEEFHNNVKIFIQCTNCGSCGPISVICLEAVLQEKTYQHVLELIMQRYKTRRQWNHGFVNPYYQDES